MSTADFDVAICGAGPAGCALALLLAVHAQAPHRIALIGKEALATDHAYPHNDPRSLALNYGSASLLHSVQAWPTQAAALIKTVHVSQQGRLGRTRITADEQNVPFLGGVVRYDTVVRQLQQAVANSGIHFIQSTVDLSQNLLDGATIRTQDGVIRSRIKVLCDGLRPQGIARHYQQDGIIATVRASRPQPTWAYERFTKSGPFALLPHPDGEDLYALVWCMPPADAKQLMALPSPKFEHALQHTFGARLGTLRLASQRSVFPLSLYAGPTLPARDTVAIGNAAQTLHPVAGQGLNLGLRDAAQLAHALRPWLSDPTQAVDAVLNQYMQRRRVDRWTTATITDILPRVFATTNPIVQHACGLALLALDASATARRPLVTQLLQGTRS